MDSFSPLKEDISDFKESARLIDEKVFVSSFVNLVCANDPILTVRHIPLKASDCDNIFVRVKDSLILSCLLNSIKPGCVDNVKLCTSHKPSQEEKQQNLKIVFEGAASIGFELNSITAKEILSGSKAKVLSFIWQCIWGYLVGVKFVTADLHKITAPYLEQRMNAWMSSLQGSLPNLVNSASEIQDPLVAARSMDLIVKQLDPAKYLHSPMKEGAVEDSIYLDRSLQIAFDFIGQDSLPYPPSTFANPRLFLCLCIEVYCKAFSASSGTSVSMSMAGLITPRTPTHLSSPMTPPKSGNTAGLLTRQNSESSHGAFGASVETQLQYLRLENSRLEKHALDSDSTVARLESALSGLQERELAYMEDIEKKAKEIERLRALSNSSTSTISELRQLQAQHVTLQQQADGYLNEIADLTSKVMGLEVANKELEKEFQSTTLLSSSRLVDLEDQIRVMLAEKASAKALRDLEMSKLVDRINENAGVLDKSVREYELANESKSKLIDSLNANLAVLKDKEQTLVDENKEYLKEIMLLQKQLQDSSCHREILSGELQQCQTRLTTISAKEIELVTEVADLRSKLAGMEFDASHSTRDKDDSIIKLEEMTSTIAVLSADKVQFESTIAALTQKLSLVEEELVQCRGLNEVQEGKIAKLKSSLTDSKQHRKQATAELTEKNKEIDRLKSELAMANDNLAALSEELQRQRDIETDLNVQLNLVEAEISSWKLQAKDLNASNMLLTESIAQLEQDLKYHRDNEINWKQEASSKAIDKSDLQQAINTLELDLRHANEQLHELRLTSEQQKQELVGKMVTLQATIEAYELSTSNLVQQIENKKCLLETRQVMVDTSMCDLDALKEEKNIEISNLSAALQVLESSSSHEIARLKVEIMELTSIRDTQATKISKLKADLKEIREQENQQKDIIKQKSDIHSKLEFELQDAKSAIDELTSKLESAVKDLNALQDQMKEYRHTESIQLNELAEMRSRVVFFEDENIKLKDAVTAVNEEFERSKESWRRENLDLESLLATTRAQAEKDTIRADADIRNYQDDISELSKNLNDLRQDLADQIAKEHAIVFDQNLRDHESIQLKKNLQVQMDLCSKLEFEIHDKNDSISLLQRQEVTLKDSILSLESQIAAGNVKLLECQHLVQLKEEHLQESEASISSLSNLLAGARADNEAMKAAADRKYAALVESTREETLRWTSDLVARTSRIDELENQICQLQESNQKAIMGESLAQHEISRLKNQIVHDSNSNALDIEDLRKQLSSAISREESLLKNQSELSAKLEAKLAKVSDVEAEMWNEKIKSETYIHDLENKLTETTTEVNQLQSILSSNQTELALVKQEKSRLEVDFSEAQSLIQTQVTKLKKIKDKHAEFKANEKQNAAEIRRLKEVIESLTIQLDSSEQSMQGTENEFVGEKLSLVATIAGQESAINELKGLLQDLNDRFRAAQDQLHNLEQEKFLERKQFEEEYVAELNKANICIAQLGEVVLEIQGTIELQTNTICTQHELLQQAATERLELVAKLQLAQEDLENVNTEFQFTRHDSHRNADEFQQQKDVLLAALDTARRNAKEAEVGLKDSIQDLTKKFQDTSDALIVEQQLHRDVLAKNAADFENERNECNGKLRKLQDELVSLQESSATKDWDLDDCNRAIAELKQNIAIAENNMQKREEEFQLRVEELLKKQGELQQHVVSLETVVDSMRKSNGEMNEIVENLKNEMQSMSIQLKNSGDELSGCRVSLNDSLEDNKSLKSRISELTAILTDARNVITHQSQLLEEEKSISIDFRDKNESLLDELGNRDEELLSLQNMLTGLKSARNSYTDELHEKLAALRTCEARQVAEIADLRSRIMGLEKILEEYADLDTKSKEKLVELQHEIEVLSTERKNEKLMHETTMADQLKKSLAAEHVLSTSLHSRNAKVAELELALQTNNAELQFVRSDMNNKNFILQQELEAAKLALEDCQTNFENLQLENAVKFERINSSETSYQELSQFYQESKHALEAANNKIKSDQLELKTLREKFAFESNKLIMESQQESSKMMAKYRLQESHCQELEANLANATNTIVVKANELDCRHREVLGLKALLEAQSVGSKHEQEMLQENIKYLEEKAHESASKLAQSNAACFKLAERNSLVEQQLDDANRNVEALDAKLLDQIAINQAGQAHFESILAKKSNKNQEEITRLHNNIKNAEAENENYRQTISSLQLQLTDMASKIEFDHSMIHHSDVEASFLHMQMAANDVERIRDELMDSLSREDELIHLQKESYNELTTMVDVVRDLEKTNESNAASIEQLKREKLELIDASLAEESRIADILDNLRNVIASQRVIIEGHESSIRDIQSHYKLLQSTIANKESEIGELMSEIERLRQAAADESIRVADVVSNLKTVIESQTATTKIQEESIREMKSSEKKTKESFLELSVQIRNSPRGGSPDKSKQVSFKDSIRSFDIDNNNDKPDDDGISSLHLQIQELALQNCQLQDEICHLNQLNLELDNQLEREKENCARVYQEGDITIQQLNQYLIEANNMISQLRSEMDKSSCGNVVVDTPTGGTFSQPASSLELNTFDHVGGMAECYPSPDYYSSDIVNSISSRQVMCDSSGDSSENPDGTHSTIADGKPTNANNWRTHRPEPIITRMTPKAIPRPEIGNSRPPLAKSSPQSSVSTPRSAADGISQNNAVSEVQALKGSVDKLQLFLIGESHESVSDITPHSSARSGVTSSRSAYSFEGKKSDTPSNNNNNNRFSPGDKQYQAKEANDRIRKLETQLNNALVQLKWNRSQSHGFIEQIQQKIAELHDYCGSDSTSISKEVSPSSLKAAIHSLEKRMIDIVEIQHASNVSKSMIAELQTQLDDERSQAKKTINNLKNKMEKLERRFISANITTDPAGKPDTQMAKLVEALENAYITVESMEATIQDLQDSFRTTCDQLRTCQNDKKLLELKLADATKRLNSSLLLTLGEGIASSTNEDMLPEARVSPKAAEISSEIAIISQLYAENDELRSKLRASTSGIPGSINNTRPPGQADILRAKLYQESPEFSSCSTVTVDSALLTGEINPAISLSAEQTNFNATNEVVQDESGTTTNPSAVMMTKSNSSMASSSSSIDGDSALLISTLKRQNSVSTAESSPVLFFVIGLYFLGIYAGIVAVFYKKI